MANLPKSRFFSDPRPSSSSFGAGPSTSGANTSKTSDHDQGDPSRAKIAQLILDLNDCRTRENALYLLDKIRSSIQDLHILLWHSFGTMYSLLKEILAVYRLISAQNLTHRASSRVCRAVVLFKLLTEIQGCRLSRIYLCLVIAFALLLGGTSTFKGPVREAAIPSYIFPLLYTENKEMPYEYLRLTSLGVIGSLVKAGDAEVVSYLIQNEIFIYCIRCMEVGGELSKTVATYIVYKIIINEEGLRYCCALAQRFYAVSRALGNMLECRAELPEKRLLKYIIHCYLRLSHNPRARDGLRTSLPASLRNPNIINFLRDDPTTVGFLQQLLYNVSMGHQHTVI